jgi:hypothetical protein
MTKSQLMYIEFKGDDLAGPGRIARITLSKTGKTLTYSGRKFQSLKGNGYKANYVDLETGEHCWISGCRRDGNDALYPATIEIDEDVRETYWRNIRRMPERVGDTTFRSHGKYSKGGRHTK